MLTLLFLIFQADSILSPSMVAVVTAIVTLIIGAIGIGILKDKVHASSRIKGLITSLVAAYGIIAPQISSFPKSVGVVIAIIGLVITLTSGRLQGPADA